MSDVKKFTQFIESNSFLLDFFKEFPSKLMELLLKSTPIATFVTSDTIEIDVHRMNSYLKSDESIFDQIESITDFLDALSIVGFYRVNQKKSSEKRAVIRLKNSGFKSNRLPAEDLYKRENVTTAEKKTSKKKPSRKEKSENSDPLEAITLISNLNRMSMRELKMTSLEFARCQMSMMLAVKRDASEIRTQPDTIDFQMAQPDYMKSGEIAGFYGDASLDDLKKAFGKYLPTPVEAVSDSEFVDIVAEVIEIGENAPKAPKKAKKPRGKYKPRKRQAIEMILEADDDSQQSIPLVETPKRKYARRTPRKILPEETEQAIDFIQKENTDQEKEEILEFLCDLNSGKL